MSNETLEQKLNRGGPDTAVLTAALSAIRFGTMLEPRQYQPTFAAAFILDMRVLGLPPVSIGGSVRAMAGTLTTVTATGLCYRLAGTLATPVPASGLTVGASNAQVHLVPKPGMIVRYAQFNPAIDAGGGGLSNMSQGLKVYVTGSGQVWEVWTQLANNSSGIATSLASDVVTALKANTQAAAIFQSIDTGTGNGASAAVESPDAITARPNFSVATAGGAGLPPATSDGRVVHSLDGNLLFLPADATQIDLQYRPAPAQSLLNFYPGSF